MRYDETQHGPENMITVYRRVSVGLSGMATWLVLRQNLNSRVTGAVFPHALGSMKQVRRQHRAPTEGG